MPFQLPADCLNEIFEYLEDRVDLHSCLLVNRLWCKVTVRILWRTIQNHTTLINCLPNESKEFLFNNGVIIQTSKLPLFNYMTFIKILSIEEVCRKILILQKLNYNKSILITQ